MSLLTIQEALNEINGSTGLTQQEAANELAVAVAAVASSGALTLTNTTTDNTISVDQNGNVGTDVATDGAVHIENTGNTGIGLGVYTNIGATADAPLVSIKADNVAFDNDVLQIVNDGVGASLRITQSGTTPNSQTDGALMIINTANNGIGFNIYSNNGASQVNALAQIKSDNPLFEKNVLQIVNDGTGSAIDIVQNGTTVSAHDKGALTINNTANNGTALNVYSNNTASQVNALVSFKADNPLFDTTILNIINDGIGRSLNILHTDDGINPTVDITRVGNNVAYIFGMKMTVDNSGVGGLVCGIDFSGMSDTEPLFKLTSTDTDLSTKSPETDAEAGWFPVLVGTTKYAVPIYALA